VIQQSEALATQNKAEKLIVKVRLEHFDEFLFHGFCCEGKLDGYFLGSDAYFFTKYYQSDRRKSEDWLQEDDMINQIFTRPRETVDTTMPRKLVLKKVMEADCNSLAALYKDVFPVYPTPLHDPEYIKKTIDEGTIYYSFLDEEKMVSAASAEVNLVYRNAELTDCATLQSHRKHGLMKFLLKKLEEELIKSGIYCSYSLSRAKSYGMNAVFHQLGYSYRGRLINNCFIYQELEDMNIWIKNLSGSS
jgi:putative beta-lysine N-acetyltransferase